MQVPVPQFQRVNPSQRPSLNHKAQALQPAFPLQSQSVNQRHSVSRQVPVPQFQRVNPSQRQSLNRKAQVPQFQIQ